MASAGGEDFQATGDLSGQLPIPVGYSEHYLRSVRYIRVYSVIDTHSGFMINWICKIISGERYADLWIRVQELWIYL